MPTGQEFIKHEFDEAIAVQQTIVRGAGELARVHPMQTSKQMLQATAKESTLWLKRLQKAGSKFGATGEREEVAGGIDQLATTTLKNAAGGEPSEVYEAHAVLINALRKQQDSAGAVIKIATSIGDRELAAEGREMQRDSKRSADDLAKNLTELAVAIATEGRETRPSTTAGRSSAATRSTKSGSTKSSSTKSGSAGRGKSAAGRTSSN